MTPAELAVELHAARDEFFGALEAFAPESMTTPGLVGEWSAREVVAHLGYWCGNATEAIQTAEYGPNDPDASDVRSQDEINETVARVARQTGFATVRRREAASFEALVDRAGALDPGLLAAELPDGGTLADAIRADGHAHYREHAVELRQILAARST